MKLKSLFPIGAKSLEEMSIYMLDRMGIRIDALEEENAALERLIEQLHKMISAILDEAELHENEDFSWISFPSVFNSEPEFENIKTRLFIEQKKKEN